jgi:mannitol PTS system EIIA component
MSILAANRIQLAAHAADKLDAIRQAGALLVASNCVLPPYVDGMLARETTMSTCLGSGVAIPHGEYDNREHVLATAVCVLQLDEPIEWEPGEMVRLVIGIAASSDEHVGVLARLANVIEDEDALAELQCTDDPGRVLALLGDPPIETVENVVSTDEQP